MIRTICAVFMLMCTLPCLAGDGAKGKETPAVRMLLPAGPPGALLFYEYDPKTSVEEVRLAAEVVGSEKEKASVVRVEYLVDGKVVAKAAEPPFEASWKGTAGNHTLKARAVFTDGAEALSDPRPIMVAKSWCFPPWVRYTVVSPYDTEEAEEDANAAPYPPPEKMQIDGVTKPKGVLVVPAELPESAPRRPFLTRFTAYRIYGDIPPNGADVSLPVKSWDVDDLQSIGMYRFDSVRKEWEKVPGKMGLSRDLYAAVTARVTRPGIYTVSTSVTKDKEPPKVTWLLPEEGAVIKHKARLLVAVSDNYGIRDVRFVREDPSRPDDGTANLLETMPGEGPQWESPGECWGESGCYAATGDFSMLVSGTYEFMAVAEDIEANETTAVRKVRIETKAVPPKVTVESTAYDPESGYVVITGTVSDDDDEVRNLRVTLDVLLNAMGEGKPLWSRSDVDRETGNWTSYMNMLPPGEHTLYVQAWDEHSNETNVESKVSLPLSAAQIHTVELSPQLLGNPITVAAFTVGGVHPEFKLEVSADSGATWSLLHDYPAPDLCPWTPSEPGTYMLRVTTREQGTTQPEFSADMSYVIAAPLSGVSLSAIPASPQPPGTRVILKATAVGGRYPLYKLEVSDGVEWKVLSDFDGWHRSWPWTPSTPGTYILKVSAREGTSQVFTDGITYKITPAKEKDGKR